MENRGRLISITKMLSRLAIVLLLGTYLFNLHLEKPFRTKSEKIGKNASFFDESEAETVPPFELDFIRDSIIPTLAPGFSSRFFHEENTSEFAEPSHFLSIYLEILIPPPRTSSQFLAVS